MDFSGWSMVVFTLAMKKNRVLNHVVVLAVRELHIVSRVCVHKTLISHELSAKFLAQNSFDTSQSISCPIRKECVV